MSVFGFNFVVRTLRELGWPKKQGLFGPLGVDPSVLDSAVDTLIDYSAALGAGRPQRAVQLLAHMLPNMDWGTGGDASLADMFESIGDSWGNRGASPSDEIEPVRFSSEGRYLDNSDFSNPKFQSAIEMAALSGLFWGLRCPEAFAEYYARNTQKSTAMQSELERSRGTGSLPFRPLPSLEDFFAESEALLHAYEMDAGEFPPIPDRVVIEKILAEARGLGRHGDS